MPSAHKKCVKCKKRHALPRWLICKTCLGIDRVKKQTRNRPKHYDNYSC